MLFEVGDVPGGVRRNGCYEHSDPVPRRLSLADPAVREVVPDRITEVEFLQL